MPSSRRHSRPGRRCCNSPRPMKSETVPAARFGVPVSTRHCLEVRPHPRVRCFDLGVSRCPRSATFLRVGIGSDRKSISCERYRPQVVDSRTHHGHLYGRAGLDAV